MVIRFLWVMVFIFSGAIFAQDSIVTVTAEQGEGIYALLRRNGLDPGKNLQLFLAANEKNLVNGNQLVVGRSYQIPLKQGSMHEMGTEIDMTSGEEFPIFGKKFSKINPQSTQLENTVYYLVSGHGGPDPGAVGVLNGKTIAEDEYAYDVTLRLARELLEHGAKVYVIVRDENDGIRDEKALALDTDETVYPNNKIPLGQLDRLKQRVEVVNDLYLKNRGKYQRLIVTHVDSRSKGQNIDVFFYHHETSKNGKALAESIHQTFKAKYKKYQPYREYTGTFSDRSNLYMVKNTLPAMAYIEIGNLKNQKDQRRILDPENRQALAKWISEGIILDRNRAVNKNTSALVDTQFGDQ